MPCRNVRHFLYHCISNNVVGLKIAKMKKHELLKQAYDNYPKGTKFKSLSGNIFESTGVFGFNYGSILRVEENGRLKGNVYTKDWAEIVEPYPTAKVENEKELSDFECNHGKIYDFAKDQDVKFPLLKSEDGVWLYKGDSAIPVNTKSMELGNDRYKADEDTSIGDTFKYFSTKQSALDWIEAQKPKSQEICLGKGFYAIVFKDRFEFKGCIPNGLDSEQLHDITETMKDLS